MGIYYMAVNHAKREYIDPFNLKGSGIKSVGVVCGQFANLVMVVHMHGDLAIDWTKDHFIIAGDYSDDYEKAAEGYKNVTREAIEMFNHFYGGVMKLEYDPRETARVL